MIFRAIRICAFAMDAELDAVSYRDIESLCKGLILINTEYTAEVINFETRMAFRKCRNHFWRLFA